MNDDTGAKATFHASLADSFWQEVRPHHFTMMMNPYVRLGLTIGDNAVSMFANGTLIFSAEWADLPDERAFWDAAPSDDEILRHFSPGYADHHDSQAAYNEERKKVRDSLEPPLDDAQRRAQIREWVLDDTESAATMTLPSRLLQAWEYPWDDPSPYIWADSVDLRSLIPEVWRRTPYVGELEALAHRWPEMFREAASVEPFPRPMGPTVLYKPMVPSTHEWSDDDYVRVDEAMSWCASEDEATARFDGLMDAWTEYWETAVIVSATFPDQSVMAVFTDSAPTGSIYIVQPGHARKVELQVAVENQALGEYRRA